MNLQTMHWVILFAFGAMVVNTIGIWLMHRYRDWAERSKEYFMCFAAGVLIATPFLIAFPEAVEKNNKAAGTRARKSSLDLEKLLKEFRKVSVEASKK